jgi:hypothetical protein
MAEVKEKLSNVTAQDVKDAAQQVPAKVQELPAKVQERRKPVLISPAVLGHGCFAGGASVGRRVEG